MKRSQQIQCSTVEKRCNANSNHCSITDLLSKIYMPTNNYKRNDLSFGKLLFSKHHHNIFRHESSTDAKTNE